MGLPGWALLIGGSIVVGIAVPLVRDVAGVPYRWVLASIGAFVGAYVASEWLFATAEPVWEGLALWPALICGLVVAIVVDVATVLLVQGSGHGTAGHGRPVG